MTKREKIKAIIANNYEAFKQMVETGEPLVSIAEIITEKVYSGEFSIGEELFSNVGFGVAKEDFRLSMMTATGTIRQEISLHPELKEIYNTPKVAGLRNRALAKRYADANLKNGIKFGVAERGNDKENRSKRKEQRYFATSLEELSTNQEAVYSEAGLGHTVNNMFGVFKKLTLAGYTPENIAELLHLDKDLVDSTLNNGTEVGEMLKMSKALLVAEISENLIKAAMPGTIREMHYKYDGAGDAGADARLDKVVVRDKPADATAMTKILEKFNPDFWKEDKAVVNIEGVGVMRVKEHSTDLDAWSAQAKLQQKEVHRKQEEDK